MPKTTFWFAEYDIKDISHDITDFDPSRSEDEYIQESLQEYVRTGESVASSATGKWYFGAIDDRGSIILGKFGKEFTDETSEYDEEAGDFVDDADERVDAQYSMFILDTNNNLLIYNTRNRVGHQQFIRNFSKGYNNRHNGRMTITLLENAEDIDTVISEYRVFDAKFELEPSNPASGPEWEELDDHIKEMLAKKLDVEAEAMEGSGLNFSDEVLAQIYKMAKSEYGEFEIYYDDQGYVKKISSGDGEPIVQRHPEPNTLGGLANLSSELINYGKTFLDPNEDTE